LSLKELNLFINEKIGNIPSKLIKDIENLILNFRNPSAHIETLDQEAADNFNLKYKKIMNELLSILS